MSLAYKYNCIDRSVLLPWFKKYHVNYFFKLIPHFLTANWITLISSIIMFGIWGISFMKDITGASLLYALGVYLYVVLDHLDGMQAKYTQTSSPLGEFLDHYFDIYNSAIVLWLYYILFPVPKVVFYILLYFFLLAYAITMLEEKIRKELYFGPVGSLEGVLLTIIVFLSLSVSAGFSFWMSNISEIFRFPMYSLLLLAVFFGSVFTIADSWKRIRSLPGSFYIFTLNGFILLWVCCQKNTPVLEGFLLITFYFSDYIGKIMESYLCSKPLPQMGKIGLVVTFVLLASLVAPIDNKYIFSIAALVLFLQACNSALLTFSQMKHYWLWKNSV